MTAFDRKTLPEDFAEQLTTKSLPELKELFRIIAVNARDKHSTNCAIAFPQCPDELTRWLVGQGLNVDEPSSLGWSPLAVRAETPGANLAILLELGANIDGPSQFRAPLIRAVYGGSLEHVKLLIEQGADPLKPRSDGSNALEAAVEQCTRRHISTYLPIVEYLASLTRRDAVAGWRRLFGPKTPVYPITGELINLVEKHGQSLEARRFNIALHGDVADEADLARFERGVRRLCQLFELPAVPVIPLVDIHDGVSPIIATGTGTHAKYVQLWEMLVPPSGPARTVQGEVIRIVGRLRHEIEGNGGINWSDDFRAMQDALVTHLASGNAIADENRADAVWIINETRDGDLRDGMSVLDKAAVAWVELNPEPVPLAPPPYLH